MTQPIIVSGSLAFDYIMDFPGVFKDHLMLDQLHILNVCFVVSSLKKSWGGTAGNIAYAMKMLGGDPLVVGVVGKDGQEYVNYLKQFGLNTQYIHQDPEQMTAAANIITDQDDNQITSFFGGSSLLPALPEALKNNLVLISPSAKNTMLAHSQAAYNQGAKVVFDPGQQVTAFNKDELQQLISQADIVIGNDYEIALLSKNSGWSEDELLTHASLLITTLGKEGSRLRSADGKVEEIKPCLPKQLVDPTGAGDCFRAGFFSGYTAGKTMVQCASIGSVAAAYCIENAGTQSYSFSQADFAARYTQTYNEQLTLS